MSVACAMACSIAGSSLDCPPPRLIAGNAMEAADDNGGLGTLTPTVCLENASLVDIEVLFPDW